MPRDSWQIFFLKNKKETAIKLLSCLSGLAIYIEHLHSFLAVDGRWRIAKSSSLQRKRYSERLLKKPSTSKSIFQSDSLVKVKIFWEQITGQGRSKQQPWFMEDFQSWSKYGLCKQQMKLDSMKLQYNQPSSFKFEIQLGSRLAVQMKLP